MKFNWNLYAPTKESSPIRVVVNHHGKTYYKAIGITVPTKQWKIPKRGPQYCTDSKVAEKMRKIDLYLHTYLDDGSSDEDVKKVLSGIAAGRAELPVETPEAPKTFWEFWDEYAARERPAKRQHVSTNRIVGEIMGRYDNWDDLTADWFRRLIEGFNERNYSENYKSSMITKIKSCLQEAFDKGLHNNAAFLKVKKNFMPSDTVYLTEEEIERLWNLELKDKHQREVRDLFLLGFYCAARFGDYSRIDKSMIRDGVIHLTSRKTGVESLIPCSPRVETILKRNGGKAPQMSQEELNREIKVVCMRAKINQPITTTIVKGGKQVREVNPKWKLISSHTARRSAATQLVLQGLPEKSVMLLTGHKTHSSFATYVRLTKEENAATLKDNPFFKK